MDRPALISVTFALVAAILALAACSGGGNHVASRKVPAPAAEEPSLPGLPALPADEPLPGDSDRRASVNVNLTLDGVDYYDTNALVNGFQSLHLTPNADGLPPLIWAIYRLPGLAPDADVSTLSAGLSSLATGEDYYLALADYSAGNWELFSRTAESAGETHNLAAEFDITRHLSPGGNVFFAVLAFNHACDVDFVTLLASTSLAAPQNLSASDGTTPESVGVSWDVVPGAEMYEVFYKEAAQPDEFYGFLVETSGDTDNPGFSHTAEFPPGKTAIYGTEYEYKVRATADGEEPSAFSAPDTGRRQLPAPQMFTATDRLHPDGVAAAFRSPQTWPGMRSFKLFRDGEDTGVDDFSSVGDWFFLSQYETDFEQHEYYVIETGPEGDSPPSAVDQGSRADWLHTLFASTDVRGQFRADMNYAAHSPELAALCYGDPSTDWIHYGWINGGLGMEQSEVVQADPDADMCLIPFGERPWIAFDNNTEAYGPEAVYIARGKVAAPAGPADWDVYPVVAGGIRGEDIVLREIGGRLALVCAVEVEPGTYALNYGFAATDDPLGPEDWFVGEITAFPISNPLNRFSLVEFQGVPLVAYQGEETLSVAQATSLTPSGSGDWTHFELPLAGRINSQPEGVDLLIYNGMVHIASLEGGAESPGQLIISRTESWPPVPADWQESEFFSSESIAHGGVSFALRGNHPFLLWSGEDVHGAQISTPALLNDELLWNLDQWMLYELLPDEKYSESIYNVRLVRLGTGEMAAMYTMKDGDISDLYCSQVLYH